MSGVRDYSVTADDNLSVGGISIAENMLRASVNNAMRAGQADIANLLLDFGGATATTGSSNAYAITLPTTPAAYGDNMLFGATANFSNTAAATMDVNGLGAKDVKKLVAGGATALSSGDFPASHIGLFTYSTVNSAIILLNPANTAVGSVAGLGTNVAAFLATPSSANLKAALTDETGSGAAVFGTSPTIADAIFTSPIITTALLTAPTLTMPDLGTPISATLTYATGLPISTGVSGLGSNVATFLATPSSVNLKAALTDETGSGAAVFATSPTLVTPALGTPSSGTMTYVTGLPVDTGISGFGTGVATFLGTPSSANLKAALTDETGSGAAVFATSPTLVTATLTAPTMTTPALGTPDSGTLTNATGLPVATGISGLGSNVAAFLASATSANLASAVTDETGSGALVFATSPVLTTPNLGTPSALTLTSATGLPVAGLSNLGTGVGTFLTTPTSANLAAAVTDELGSGSLLFSGVIDTDTALASNSDSLVASQKATKAYIDATSAGINPAAGGSVATSTTANISLTGEQTIDGVLTSASRILVKNQSTATQNGIYVTAAGAWARATDADAGLEFVHLNVFVIAGDTQAGTVWVCTRSVAPTLGVDNISFVQNGATQVYSAGFGLTLAGSEFAITDSELVALAGTTSAADKLPYFSGAGTAATTDFTSQARSLLDDTTAAAMATTIGLGTSNSPQFTAVNVGAATDTTIARAAAGRITIEGLGAVRGPVSATDNAAVRFDATTGDLAQDSVVIISDTGNVTGVANITTTGAIELGNASDTTIARSGAGDVTIEGNAIYRAGGTDVPVADGGTGSSTAAGAATNLGLGTGDSPQFAAVNIGAASDTTIARAAAGRITIEGLGAVRGPASATDNAAVRFDATTGDLTQDSVVIIGDTGNVTGVAALSATTIELGAVSDTTISRASAGDLNIEGNIIYRAGGTDVAVADGGTGASTATTAATNLGLGTGDSPQFTAVNIGAATDTTVSRASAGDIAVEGNIVYRAGGTDVAIADGGTGASSAAAAATNLGLGTGDSPTFTAVNLASTDTTLTRVAAGRASLEGVPIVRGPLNATNTALVRYSGSSGDLVQNSGIVVDGSNNIIGLGTIASTGTATVTKTSAGAATVALSVINSSVTASTEAQVMMTPSTAGAGVRAAYVSAVQEGSNTIRLSLAASGSTGAAPAEGAYLRNGFVIGVPTGTDKGAGTLNVESGAYINNVAITTVSSSDTLTNKTLTSPTINGITNGTGIASGTYTPTATSVANVDSTSALAGYYVRIASNVHVWGTVTINPTLAAGTETKAGISLPVASDLATGVDLTGVLIYPAGLSPSGVVVADTANNRAEIQFGSTSSSDTVYNFQFDYVIK